jgi:hypothetical protein
VSGLPQFFLEEIDKKKYIQDCRNLEGLKTSTIGMFGMGGRI